MIKANIYDKKLVVEEHTVADSVKFDTVGFSFPDNWNGYTKTAVFTAENGEIYNVILDKDNPLCVNENECYIPHEVIKSPCFYLSVFGVNGDSIATTTQAKVTVLKSGYGEGDEPKEPTPTEYQQIINLVDETKFIAQSVRDDADNGVFNGEKGQDAQTDQTFNPESENAQSGKAVAEVKKEIMDFSGSAFASAIKNTASGSVISLNDVSPIEHELNVNVRRKNLFNVALNAASDNSNNTTYDGDIITTNFTNGSLYLNFKKRVKYPAGTYTFSVIPLSDIFYGCIFAYSVSDTSLIFSQSIGSDRGLSLTYTFTADTEFYLCLGGLSGSNGIFYGEYSYRVQLEKGANNTEYTQHVEDLSEVTVSRYGKNLFNTNNKKYAGGSVVKENKEGSITVSQNAAFAWSSANFPMQNILEGQAVTVSANISTSGKNKAALRIMWISPDGGASGSHILTKSISGSKQYVSVSGIIPTQPTAEHNRLCLMLYSNTDATLNSGVEYTATYSDIQIEIGNTATEYEQYMDPQTVAVSEDGNVDGLISISPNITMTASAKGAVVNCTYNADTKKYIDNKFELLTAAVANN